MDERGLQPGHGGIEVAEFPHDLVHRRRRPIRVGCVAAPTTTAGSPRLPDGPRPPRGTLTEEHTRALAESHRATGGLTERATIAETWAEQTATRLRSWRDAVGAALDDDGDASALRDRLRPLLDLPDGDPTGQDGS